MKLPIISMKPTPVIISRSSSYSTFQHNLTKMCLLLKEFFFLLILVTPHFPTLIVTPPSLLIALLWWYQNLFHLYTLSNLAHSIPFTTSLNSRSIHRCNCLTFLPTYLVGILTCAKQNKTIGFFFPTKTFSFIYVFHFRKCPPLP